VILTTRFTVCPGFSIETGEPSKDQSIAGVSVRRERLPLALNADVAINLAAGRFVNAGRDLVILSLSAGFIELPQSRFSEALPVSVSPV
jgi:hypothetical protein